MNNTGGGQAKHCPITQSFTEQKVHVAWADDGAFPFGQSVHSPTVLHEPGSQWRRRGETAGNSHMGPPSHVAVS